MAQSKIKKSEDDMVIAAAMRILEKRTSRPSSYIGSPKDTVDMLRIHLHDRECEYFTVVFLDARHGVIAKEDMFRGGLTGAAVYTGQVVRQALKYNAAALVVAHNHPSGVSEPSAADRELTERLRQGLVLVEIRLLDHIVVAGSSYTSFAERGWI